LKEKAGKKNLGTYGSACLSFIFGLGNGHVCFAGMNADISSEIERTVNFEIRTTL